MAVGYKEWLQDWTFPSTDDRVNVSSVAEMAAWNDGHNATTGSLGKGTWWWDALSGQNFYDLAARTDGAMGEAFWTAFGWGRFTARQAIDSAHVHVTEGGEVVQLDGLLVPNGRAGNAGNACASLPAYAGYPVASVPVGQDGYDVPFALGIYGRQYGEAKLATVASAMEDLFGWDAKPKWHNYRTAEGPWQASWPGFTCSPEGLDRQSCVAAAAVAA